MIERTATFPPEASSPRRARHLVAGELGLGSLANGEIAALLTSELATNAVRHAQTDFTVTVQVHDDRLRVAVSDQCQEWPIPANGMPSSSVRSGRGLVFVDSYATDWGVDPFPGGKVVWFTLAFVGSAGLAG